MKKLITIAALAFASAGSPTGAAKLCILKISDYSYAYNKSTGIWAVGVDCGELIGGAGEPGSKTGTTPAELCNGPVVISGTSARDENQTCSCVANYPTTLYPRIYSVPGVNCGQGCGNIFRTTPNSAVLL